MHSGIVKNKVIEFVGPGIKNLSMDFRNGIDVMTTETACLSSVWQTDEIVRTCMAAHGRANEFKTLAPEKGAYYDVLIELDLGEIEPMIALPFHPKNAYSIREFKENMKDILHEVDETAKLQFGKRSESLLNKIKDGKFYVDQGVIAGCSGGTYQNLVRAAEILAGRELNGFNLSVYPASQPIMLELMRTGKLGQLMQAGASVRSCFCGPCFGAGDVPRNGGFSIRHSTRNFPNREGSRPSDGQLSYVALMDARSIAATAINGGALTSAFELEVPPRDTAEMNYVYNDSSYKASVYRGVGKPDKNAELVFGPNITDWPEQIALPDNLLLTFTATIYDSVTTTDELIPSGETSSYRSNPLKLAEFALSRRVPEYVGRCKEIFALEQKRRKEPFDPDVMAALGNLNPLTTGLGSILLAIRPGDGSAREQAASCQRVLGGCANLCEDFATKRYRSNVVNWGMLPFTRANLKELNIQPMDQLYLPNIREKLMSGAETVDAVLKKDGKDIPITLELHGLTREERDIILKGCLINYYAE